MSTVEAPATATNGAVAVEAPLSQMPFNAHVVLPETGAVVGTGFVPSLPDMRDCTPESAPVVEMAQQLGVGAAPEEALRGPQAPSSVDLRQWCSPVENQMALGSCTAHAAVGIVEYYERRAFNHHLDGSRLFVYKATRNLLGWRGDTGAMLRTTMAALAMFGVPPEQYWPYTDVKQPGPAGARTFDDEPGAFVYEVADDFEAVRYFTHDPLGENVPTATVLERVKAYLAAGVPSMFGFYGFPSFASTSVRGGIPYPCSSEQARWGHAIVAVGYDDAKQVDNTACGRHTTGALLIRNSWGSGWGDDGYGWMPYRYVVDRLAFDFWSLIGMRWIDTKQFGL